MVVIPSSTALAVSLSHKPILHVECCTNRPEPSPHILAEEIEQWLRLRYVSVKVQQTFPNLPGLLKSQHIDFISIADLTSTSSAEIEPEVDILLSEVDIEVDVFELYGEDVDSEEPTELTLTPPRTHGSAEDHPAPQTKIMALPNRALHGIWDSLIFDDSVKFRLLRFVIRMISFSSRQLQNQISIWNRIVLLYGPPGTGKTSLCRALAQQLSIRLGNTFPLFKMVEFDAHSLYSRYFSESAKAVSKLFGKIEKLLDESEDTFVCVFIDEIESMATNREHCGKTHEPQDSLRAVNALLIALDRLRHWPNVVVFCTSNLIKAMDSAFLDRIDIKEHIPEPCVRARYEILRSVYLELARCGILATIAGPAHDSLVDKSSQDDLIDAVELVEGFASPSSSSDKFYTPFRFWPHPLGPADCLYVYSSPPTVAQTLRASPSTDKAHTIDDQDLPPWNIMMLHYPANEESLPRKLWAIAEQSMNMSGRTLRRLPMLSLAMYTREDPCSIHVALLAFSQALEKEVVVN